jgi:hypothetical protein
MERNESGELQLPDEQELNLLYVATTRGLKWVELSQDLLEFFESEFKSISKNCVPPMWCNAVKGASTRNL